MTKSKIPSPILILLLSLLLLVSIPLSADSEGLESSKMGLGMYVVVDDIKRAKEFYQQVFKRKASVDYGNFVSFRIEGGIFALFSKQSFSHQLKRGNNSVPYIHVENIEAEYNRIQKIAPQMVHDAIVDEGPIKLFMFADRSGNVIEFYSLTSE